MGVFHIIFVVLYFLYFVIIIDSKDNYIVDIEKGYLLFYNKSYGDNVVFRYTKPNESIIVDASYNVLRNDVKSDATISGNIFRYANNAWKKIQFPLELNLCSAFKQNYYLPGIQDILNHGNATPCDVKMAHYYVSNFMPKIDFPPIVPSGKYKAIATIKLRKIVLIKTEWSGTLTRL